MSEGASASGRQFLDPGVDFSTASFTAEEKRRMLDWYREVHDFEDLDLAPFARFFIEHDPQGFKRLRRHVITFDDPQDGHSLPTVAGTLCFVHAYTVLGNGKGALYEVIASRQLGAGRETALETIRLATLFGGPLGLNTLGELGMRYFEVWRQDATEDSIRWPSDWSSDRRLLETGLDGSTDDLTADELGSLTNWYQRTFGEVPAHVAFFADRHPRAFKTQHLRLEAAYGGALPVQMVPLLRLHLGAIRRDAVLLRRSIQMATAFGVARPYIVATLFWAAVYGGDSVLEQAYDTAGDLLAAMGENP